MKKVFKIKKLKTMQAINSAYVRKTNKKINSPILVKKPKKLPPAPKKKQTVHITKNEESFELVKRKLEF